MLMHLIAVAKGAGGLFDFSATLPLMAILFVLLTVVLTFVFYKPVSKLLDEREARIRENLRDAANRFVMAYDIINQVDETELIRVFTNTKSVLTASERIVEDRFAFDKGFNDGELDHLVQNGARELGAEMSLLKSTFRTYPLPAKFTKGLEAEVSLHLPTFGTYPMPVVKEFHRLLQAKILG